MYPLVFNETLFITLFFICYNSFYAYSFVSKVNTRVLFIYEVKGISKQFSFCYCVCITLVLDGSFIFGKKIQYFFREII